MKVKSNVSWHKSSGTKYYCTICGYQWKDDGRSKEKYCPNCYQRKIRISGIFSYLEDLLKKGRKVKMKLYAASENIRETAYTTFKENQHILDIILFILAVVIILRISVYFLIELAMP